MALIYFQQAILDLNLPFCQAIQAPNQDFRQAVKYKNHFLGLANLSLFQTIRQTPTLALQLLNQSILALLALLSFALFHHNLHEPMGMSNMGYCNPLVYKTINPHTLGAQLLSRIKIS